MRATRPDKVGVIVTEGLLPAPFSALVWPGDKSVRVAVAGEIDLATSPRLQVVMLDAIELAIPPADVRIDLTEVTFMDASGVGALVTAREAARCRGVGFTVQNPHGVVLRILDLLGLTEKLQLSQTAR